jgi:integration host factor subunit beta
MTRSDLIELVAARNGISLKRSEEVVHTLFELIATALQTGDRIEIRGFGAFFVKYHKSYLGRNPKTGETVTVNQKKAPCFRASSILKELLVRSA